MSDVRRSLPSVSSLLESDELRAMLGALARPLVVDAVRGVLDDARASGVVPDDPAAWARLVSERLNRQRRAALHPLINATGVVLHTNLGRAPLAPAAVEAVAKAAAGYSNIEYDVERGVRGSRHAHCVGLLRELTGAEDAMVVNNCAAALVLALDELSRGREAIISRGELIEIGGSFRVPEIMAKSGALLVEVGTTNRTTLADYRAALSPRTGAIVKVHRSNFTMDGFVADAPARDLAALAGEHELPLIQDHGSGLMIPLDAWGLSGEPTMREMVAAGASLVFASGDKLLGGPQAGIVVGRRSLISRLRQNPLARALRVDKLTIAALQATLALYREPARAVSEVPVLAMVTATREALRARAAALRDAIGAPAGASVVDVEGSVGGGAFPSARLASCALALPGDARVLEARLRLGDPGVVARIADDRLLVDLRAVSAASDDGLAGAIRRALA